MSLHKARAVIDGLRRLEIPVPAITAEALTTTDELIRLHRELVPSITPVRDGLFPPPIQEARTRAIGQLTSAAATGSIDVKLALKLTDEIAAAEAEVDRIQRALSLLDYASGYAATRPLVDNTAPDNALALDADEICAAMHTQVRAMVRSAKAQMAALGGRLPADATFALVATPEALEAYSAIQTDAARYQELRQVQRTLFGLVETEEWTASAWRFAEISTGLNPNAANQIGPIPGWPLADQEDAPPTDPGSATAWRYVQHVVNNAAHVWVPTITELSKYLAGKDVADAREPRVLEFVPALEMI